MGLLAEAWVVADGMPVVWAASLKGRQLPERVTGSSLITSLTEAAACDDRSVYFLGGATGVPEAALAGSATCIPSCESPAPTPPSSGSTETLTNSSELLTWSPRPTRLGPHRLGWIPIPLVNLGSWADDWRVPTTSDLQARARLGDKPLAVLFERVAVPVARPGTSGAWFRGWRVIAIDGVVLDVRLYTREPGRLR